MMYLSIYRLSRADSLRLRLTDSYSVHRVVYDLFEPVRAEGEQTHSGILFADKGEKNQERQLLILSNRQPRTPEYGKLDTRNLQDAYLGFPTYRFEIVVNPVQRNNQTGKLIPVRGRAAVARWFTDKAPVWGFTVDEISLQVAEITVDTFFKGKEKVTLSKARLTGTLRVTDQHCFSQSLCHGIGRGRAFGCGLLQIVPCA